MIALARLILIVVPYLFCVLGFLIAKEMGTGADLELHKPAIFVLLLSAAGVTMSTVSGHHVLRCWD